MSDWRSIESAPKDGTEILGWVPASNWRVIHLKKGRYGAPDEWWCPSGAWNYRSSPTHWMPLPEPPNGEKYV